MKNRIILIALAYFLCVTTASAALLTASPTVDGHASSSESWTNIYSDTETLVAILASDNEWRSALEFDISSISPGAVVDSATLNLYGVTTNQNIGVHGYTGNGTLESGDFSLSNEIVQFDPAAGWNVVDVTSFIQGEYAAASQFAGFQLRELVMNEFTEFASNEYSVESSRPFLSINFSTPVPEPSTLLLLGSGLGGLWFARRKFKA